MSSMITVEEALARVLASAENPLDEERVALDASHGRVLARELAARRTQPPFANSAMDGYAVRAADAAVALATLTVIGELAAGRAFAGAVGPGQATRIFTGAPLPEGADAIAMQEDVRREGDRITLAAPVGAGENVRPAGIDFRRGEPLLPAGRRLTPRDVALAAAGNHADLFVRRRARVAILATGDELVAPGGTLGPAQIIASNNFAVAGVVAACGGVPIDLGIAVDTMTALDEAIRRAREAEADVLVTLGGASVGEYDLVQRALVAAGMELGFWRIAHAARKTAHARAAWPHARAGSARESDLVGGLRASSSCARFCARCTESLTRAPIPAGQAVSGPTSPRTDPGRTTCARRSPARWRTEFWSLFRLLPRIPPWSRPWPGLTDWWSGPGSPKQRRRETPVG